MLFVNNLSYYLIRSSEEWKLCLQEPVDLTQGQLLAWDRLDCHHDECDVTVRRFFLPPCTWKQHAFITHKYFNIVYLLLWYGNTLMIYAYYYHKYKLYSLNRTIFESKDTNVTTCDHAFNIRHSLPFIIVTNTHCNRWVHNGLLNNDFYIINKI